MTITRNNQITEGKDRLLEQFKGKYNIESILSSYLKQSQDLEVVYEEMLDERNLVNAIGVQLDAIGNIVGELRNNRNDDDYRIAILIKIAINTSDGRIETIRSIIFSLTGATAVRIMEHYPASIYIYLEVGGNPDNSLVDAVNQLLPAGVSLGYIGYSGNDYVFTPYDSTSTEDNSYLKGVLSESVEYLLFDLVDNASNNITTDTGDSMVVYSESAITTQIYGIAAETV